MSYLQRRKAKQHTHKYFVDLNTNDAVCLCGKVRGSKKAEPGKYNAIRCFYNGYWYDSKFEAQCAMELDWRVKAGEITGWERQYHVDLKNPATDELIITHKVDFRARLPDGSYELIEAKGFETRDYKLIKKMIEVLWLPSHLDHIYIVYK